jgi:hypothetical protein
MTAHLSDRSPRELAYRENDGVEVALYWSPGADEVTVCVSDARRGAYFVVRPDPADALDAFRHPYSYVAERAAA